MNASQFRLMIFKRINLRSDRMSRDTRVPHDSRIDTDPVNGMSHLDIKIDVLERE